MQRFHLTYSSVTVLHAVSRGYRYGFDIMDVSGLPSGTVYPALRRLEQLGYVSARWEASDVAAQAKRPRRRYYEIEPRGSKALQEALRRFRGLSEPLPEAGGERAPELS